MNLKKNWKPILDQFNSKLSVWKAKTLSFGGRLTLVKSVLGNLPTYYLSLFNAPVGVINDLEKIRRKFLWGGNDTSRKIHWVAWDKVTASKEQGGLGVGTIRALNISLMVKWWGKLRNEPDSLWCRTISGAVKDIVQLGMELKNIFQIEVKSENQCLFWQDEWSTRGTLKKEFPSLYALESRKFCSVASRISNQGSISWAWKACPINAGYSRDLRSLQAHLADYRTTQGTDRWICVLTSDGNYTVEALRNRLDLQPQPIPEPPCIVWNKMVPAKVLCFVWRASLERILSALALKLRGMNIDTTLCCGCINGEECVNHLLINCPFATHMRNEILDWCGLGHLEFNSAHELLKFAATWGRCPKKRIKLQIICYGLLWIVWKKRNERLFQGAHSSISKGVRSIKSMVFHWMKHRGKGFVGDWNAWCSSPFGN